MRDVPKLIDKGPLLQIDYVTSSLDESNTEFTEDFGEFEDEQDLSNDIELQRVERTVALRQVVQRRPQCSEIVIEND